MKGLILLFAFLLAACGGSTPTKKPDGKPSDEATRKADEANLLGDQARDQLFLELDQRTADWLAAKEDSRPRAYGGLERLLQRKVDENLDLLLKAVKDPKSRRGRLIASKALGFSSNSKAVAALCGLLKAEDPELLQHALMGLARHAAPTHPVDKIAVHLDSFDPNVQCNAALALYHAVRKGAPLKGRVREDAVTRLHVLLLDDQHSGVRGNAAAALGALGDEACEEELIGLLGDEDGYVRLRAIMALSHVGTDMTIAPLIKMLHAPEPNIRRMTALSLEIVTRRLGMNIDGEVLGEDPKAWREAVAARRAGG
jgi:HEAT repeat protein